MFNGSDPSFVFVDNFSVVNSTVITASKLQCYSHILNYHHTRESQTAVIIKFVHMNGNENPANVVTKSRTYNTWFLLIKPLLFGCDMEFLREQVFSEGIENRSPTLFLSQDKGTPQKSFKIDLWYIIGD